MAPSTLYDQAESYRETTHRGSAIAEARRSSASRCLSRSVRTMSWLSSRGSPGGAACELKRLLIGGRTARRCVLMSGLSCPERYHPTRSSRSGVLLLQRPHRLHRCDLMVPHTTQAARSRRRSCPTLSGSSSCPPCFCPMRCMRPPLVDAL